MEISNRHFHGSKVTGKVGISSRDSRTERPQILPVESGRDQCRLLDFHGAFKEYSCLENSMDGGAWWATVHGVAKCRTRLSDFTLLRARSGLCNGNTKELRADWREAGTLGFKPGLSLDILICLTCLQTGLQGPTMDGYTKGVEGGCEQGFSGPRGTSQVETGVHLHRPLTCLQ